MPTIEQRLRRIDTAVGHAAGRVLFITGGETPDAELSAFLAANRITVTEHDLVFWTIYETRPGSAEQPLPLSLSAVSMVGGGRQ